MNDRLELKSRTKPTPFNGWNKINRAVKTFGDSAKIKRNGKELSLQEFINANNKDCTIYDVLKTYRGDMKLTQAKLNTLTNKISDELMEINGLNDAFKVMAKAEETWKSLPLEIRKEFSHDVKNFQQNGLKWANDKIKAEKDRIAKLKAEQEKLNQGAVNNG